MHLLTLILGIVLLSKANTLKCYECVAGSSGTCTNSRECPLAGHQCGTLTLTSFAGGFKVQEVSSKSCALAEECIEGSINFGIAKTVINSTCCNTELCNNQFALGPSKFIPNGKKCFQCKGQDCTATLNCEDTEDHCISAKVNTAGELVRMKGCASKLMCFAGIQKMSGLVGVEMSCCQGNFCNSASSTSAGLVLLWTAVVSSVVLS
ncbi:phospholipase A2 inhibitor and Ly6/PLAUR domain-containing protein-like isoform X1 [Pungitius pungitius]|uniref:phospholipase A2 inhibitor and Ly6/PLAUR domain-containing protein-like isoform X1 n=1 Tax=Pungitius pungitius TaxID=134920 RepID=UPI002E114E0B